ncbi:MAG: hypothetical protein ABW022_24740, partial [Actinoplanes sp.]
KSARPADPTRIDNRRADQKWADQMRADRGGADETRVDHGQAEPPAERKRWFGRRKAGKAGTIGKDQPAATSPPPEAAAHREPNPPAERPAGKPADWDADKPTDRTSGSRPDPAMAPPGFHVYRPSSADRPATNGGGTEDDDR